MSGLASFHFLRPEWFLALLPSGLILWSMFRRVDPARSLGRVIDPALLEHLLDHGETGRARLRPVYLLAAAWILAVLALAGPAWRKEPAPFSEDRSALFVVLKVTPSMLARDLQPTRLDRSVQKIGDLLDMRPGTRTGLVAYAGSAHLVMPLTTDAGIITYFAAELAPEVMPETGDDPLRAVELAARRLATSGEPGSIVLVADSIDPALGPGLARVHRDHAVDIHIYAVAAGPDVTPPPGSPPAPFLDESAMRSAARAGGGAFVAVTPDGRDLQELNARVTRSIAAAPSGEGDRWRDDGYFLLWPLLAVVLLFWRRGGGVEMRVRS